MDGIMDGILYERGRANRAEGELALLREENARLRAEVQASTVQLHAYIDEVKRLEGLILDWESSDVVSRIDSEDALWAEAKRIRVQNPGAPLPSRR